MTGPRECAQVSRQMYTDFKRYIAGEVHGGGDKNWPLGRLLQLACKRMSAWMGSLDRHSIVLAAFAAFQKARRQKNSGALLARSGIRLPADVLRSLSGMLEVQDLDVWGMRRFLIEFLLASSMGHVTGLPAWLDSSSAHVRTPSAVFYAL